LSHTFFSEIIIEPPPNIPNHIPKELYISTRQPPLKEIIATLRP